MSPVSVSGDDGMAVVEPSRLGKQGLSWYLAFILNQVVYCVSIATT
jgi:hypothetical protein